MGSFKGRELQLRVTSGLSLPVPRFLPLSHKGGWSLRTVPGRQTLAGLCGNRACPEGVEPQSWRRVGDAWVVTWPALPSDLESSSQGLWAPLPASQLWGLCGGPCSPTLWGPAPNFVGALLPARMSLTTLLSLASPHLSFPR